jgi:hypothetical protein
VEVAIDQPISLSASSLKRRAPSHHPDLTSPLFASRLAKADEAIAVDARTPKEYVHTPSLYMRDLSLHLPSRTTPRQIPDLG